MRWISFASYQTPAGMKEGTDDLRLCLHSRKHGAVEKHRKESDSHSEMLCELAFASMPKE
jgi:hypothetical protein